MSIAESELAEDRELRDAALAVFQADLRFIKEDLAERSVGGRIADRLSDSALDMLDEAVDYAASNRGRFAAATAAIVVWFARAPLLHVLSDVLGNSHATAEQAIGDDRCDSD
jgi:hypothetical protein